jgi:hypothetical protein
MKLRNNGTPLGRNSLLNVAVEENYWTQVHTRDRYVYLSARTAFFDKFNGLGVLLRAPSPSDWINSSQRRSQSYGIVTEISFESALASLPSTAVTT